MATRNWTFRIEKGSLIVECYNIYKDKRGHRHIRCELKKVVKTTGAGTGDTTSPPE